MKTRYRYIGSFPPPYGGVTIKNQLLYSEITKRIPVSRLSKQAWMPNKVFQILNMGLGLLPKQHLIIGVSAAGGTSLLLTKLLYRFAPANMRKSIYFMMGGTEAKRIADNPKEIEMYRCYKAIFVEMPSMVNSLKDSGVDNAFLYPNCRMKPEKILTPVLADSERLRCVFFSLIQPMKGCDLLLKVAEQMPEIDFYFYGHIDSEYSEEFLKTEATLSNVYYKGVFSGTSAETYDELRKYDLMLFPSKYKTEGVPGIIVEAKIAGIPVIASDVSYNRELIEHEIDGWILKENTVHEIINTLAALNSNRNMIQQLSRGALLHAGDWYIESYLSAICSKL